MAARSGPGRQTVPDHRGHAHGWPRARPLTRVRLRPGQVQPAADAYYEHVGGRFRFRGATSAEVENAIVTTAAHYRVAAQPVPLVIESVPV